MDEDKVTTQEPDELAESDDLLYSVTYSIRKLYITPLWDFHIVGLVLEETDDSFLVALPVSGERNKPTLDPIGLGDLPYMRLLKSAVKAVVGVTEEEDQAYLAVMIPWAIEVFPEALEMLGLEVEEVDMENEEELPEDVKAAMQAKQMLKGSVTVNPIGMTNEIVDAKVKKAILEGTFAPGSSKLKN